MKFGVGTGVALVSSVQFGTSKVCTGRDGRGTRREGRFALLDISPIRHYPRRGSRRLERMWSFVGACPRNFVAAVLVKFKKVERGGIGNKKVKNTREGVFLAQESVIVNQF